MSAQHDRTAWICGAGASCTEFPSPVERPVRLVLLGAPGAGKGTQGELLCEKFGCCPLSTGDVFRAARSLDPARLSPAMQTALGCMQRGELVSDETVIELVRERVHCMECRCGFMLDGFPRTIRQAEKLDGMLAGRGVALDAVLSFELPREEIVRRLSGRRTCRTCRSTFHGITKPPAAEGVCDRCGGELYQRVDDTPESIRVRLEAYDGSTIPLVRYYEKRGLLVPVRADGSPDQVFTRAMETLSSRMLLKPD